MATYGTINQIYVPGLDTEILSVTSALSTSIAIPLIAANLSGFYNAYSIDILSGGSWTRPANSAPMIDVILVGGGGGGGCTAGSTTHGGGGAGQLLRRTLDISSVNIGTGISIGIASGGNCNQQGGNSTFGTSGQPFYMVAYGGGSTQGDGQSGSCGPGANNITGIGSGGGGQGEWQTSWGGGGGGGGAGGGGWNADVRFANGGGYGGYHGGSRSSSEGSSSGGQGCAHGDSSRRSLGGNGGLGLYGLAGGGGGSARGVGGAGSSGGGNGQGDYFGNTGTVAQPNTGSGGGAGTTNNGGSGICKITYYVKA
jgi:hypothetical protein